MCRSRTVGALEKGSNKLIITVRSVKGGEWKVLRGSNIGFTGRKTGWSAEGFTEGVIDLGNLDVPFVLGFATDHDGRVCHGVVSDKFNAQLGKLANNRVLVRRVPR